MYFTREEFNNITRSNPDKSPKQIMDKLLQGGAQIEGFNDEPSFGEKASEWNTKYNPLNPAQQAIGFGKGILSSANALSALGQKAMQPIASKIASKITGKEVAPMGEPVQLLKQYEEPTTAGQKVGQLAENVAEWMVPGAQVAKGAAIAEKGIKGLGAAQKLGLFGKLLEGASKIGVRAGAGALEGGALGYLKSGGDVKEAKGMAALGAAIPVVGGAVGATYRGIKGALKGSVEKNIGALLEKGGAYNVEGALQKVPKAKRAFGTLLDYSKGATVLDDAGVEKQFIPEQANFAETLQAFKQAKTKLYNEYTEKALQAGEKGAVFTPSDFNKFVTNLDDMGRNSTAAFRNKIELIKGDIKNNYGSVLPDGNLTYKPTSLKDIQDYIEKLNIDVDPVGQKAAAQVSDKASSLLRETLDNKIEQSVGKGWQELRNKYSDLKSIEKSLLNQWKHSLKDSGAVGSYISGYGSIDTIVSLITGNVAGAVRGGLISMLPKGMGLFRSPERKLKNIFRALQEEKSNLQPSDISALLLGKNFADLKPNARKAAEKVTNFLKTTRPGMTIEDISNMSADEIKNLGFSSPAMGKIANKSMLQEGANPLIQEARKGKIVKLYHGTNNEFDTFNTSLNGSHRGPMFGEGIYATPNKELAKTYGKNIKEMSVEIKNPLNLNKFSKQELAKYLGVDESILHEIQGSNGRKFSTHTRYNKFTHTGVDNQKVFTDAVKAKGHDVITVKIGKNAEEYVLLDTKKLSQPLQEGGSASIGTILAGAGVTGAGTAGTYALANSKPNRTTIKNPLYSDNNETIKDISNSDYTNTLYNKYKVRSKQEPKSKLGIIEGVNLSSYATDPKYIEKIKGIMNSIGKINKLEDIENNIRYVSDKQKKGSPLIGMSKFIDDTARYYGIPTRLLMSIMRQETGYGINLKSKNNPGNIGNTTEGKTIDFDTLEEGIVATARFLAELKTK